MSPIVIFAITLFFLILLYKTNIAENTHVTKYVSFISGISTVIIILSFVLTVYQYQKNEHDKEYNQFISETEKNWIDLEKFFSNNYPYLATLYNQLNPTANLPLPQLTEEEKIQDSYKEHYACQMLFQIIENIISDKELPTKYGWSYIFINWGKSDIFRNIWKSSEKMYNPKTQDFINNLTKDKFATANDIQKYMTAMHT